MFNLFVKNAYSPNIILFKLKSFLLKTYPILYHLIKTAKADSKKKGTRWFPLNKVLTSRAGKNYFFTVVSATGATAAVSAFTSTFVVSAVASTLVSPDLHAANEVRAAIARKKNSFFMCCLF
jgi:hypothetical protein